MLCNPNFCYLSYSQRKSVQFYVLGTKTACKFFATLLCHKKNQIDTFKVFVFCKPATKSGYNMCGWSGTIKDHHQNSFYITEAVHRSVRIKVPLTYVPRAAKACMGLALLEIWIFFKSCNDNDNCSAGADINKISQRCHRSSCLWLFSSPQLHEHFWRHTKQIETHVVCLIQINHPSQSAQTYSRRKSKTLEDPFATPF